MQELIKPYLDSKYHIAVLNLSTVDGFSLYHYAQDKNNTEEDKIAAVASSISAISNSSMQATVEEEYHIVIIESVNFNMLFLQSNYQDTKCVITFCVGKTTSLATARFLIQRFAKELVELN